jgi:hypothetical protein
MKCQYDVIAVYARPSGYYEFIVKKPKAPVGGITRKFDEAKHLW